MTKASQPQTAPKRSFCIYVTKLLYLHLLTLSAIAEAALARALALFLERVKVRQVASHTKVPQ